MPDDFKHIFDGAVRQYSRKRAQQNQDEWQRNQEYGPFGLWDGPGCMIAGFVQFEGRIADWHAVALLQKRREERTGYSQRDAACYCAEEDNPAQVRAYQLRDGDRSRRGR